MDERLARRIWVRLVTAGSLDDLALPRTEEGRIDLRGLAAPQPTVVREIAMFGGVSVSQMSGQTILKDVKWHALDFSRSVLDSLVFVDGDIQGCSFEGARCRRWSVSGTTIIETSFRGADLRQTALSGLGVAGERNSFHRVDFTEADLRDTTHVSGDFVDCDFSRADLSNVDFKGDVFVNCLFEGTLNEVMFYKHHVLHKTLPPNEMKNVDFRRAKFHDVAFRGLDLETVKWPENDEHIVVDDYPAVLDRFLSAVSARSDDRAKALRGFFRNHRRWVGANQKRGVISKHDLVNFGGPGAVEEFLRITGVRP
jgi:uncharacterized protein YjbI with pentapeptide repeats